MAKIISVITQKGGVGKTTVVNALASTFAHNNYRVLAIDMDPQGNLSFSAGAESDIPATIYEILKNEANPISSIQRTPIMDIIPANILLSGIELEFTGQNREYLLRNALAPLMNIYDYIFIDSPPGLGILTVNSLTACDYVIIPATPDIFSLQGLTLVYDTIEYISKHINPRITIAGVLINKYSKFSRLHKEILGTARMICDQLGINLFKTFIHNSPTLAEAQATQMNITTYASKATGTKDFARLLKELESIFTILEMK